MSEEFKGHTPGPWKLWTGCSWRRFGSEATGTEVCVPTVATDGHPDMSFPNGGQDGPDARLLTAAPDMLVEIIRLRAENGALRAAAQEFVNDYYALGGLHSLKHYARSFLAALAKEPT